MEPFVPAPLQPFVVEQDYACYDEADQATWRFVLLHLHDHLKAHAHESYTRGLFETGLRVERIPRIEDVDRALQAFGWRAICVSGFIPPRAFQSFQAAGILPIAAEIRDPTHVAYTPAPDIIHEAAGHAPILVNEAYAGYLRRIGEVGKLAFSCPEDVEVYRAIAHLSEVKEQSAASREQVADASARLQEALAAQTDVSEATRIARLYWWTAEYGLIGTPTDFRLYGAGLLSSLGEAVFCREPGVVKVPLSVECLEVDYDITRPQPQLFVAEDFAHLLEVLAQAEAGLATMGATHDAVHAAIRSRLPAVVTFEGGHEVRGRIDSMVLEPSSNRVVALVFEDGALLPVDTRLQREGLCVGRPCTLASPHGAVATGSLERIDASVFELRAAMVHAGGRTWTAPSLVVPRGDIASVRPADDLAADRSPTPRRGPRVPPRTAADRRLRALYERAYAAWKDRAGSDVVEIFGAIHRRLAAFPEDWLLRWNLLESLIRLGASEETALADELRALEVRFAHQQPIATGLRSLRRLGLQRQERAQ